MAVRPIGPGPGAYLLPSTCGYPAHDPSRDRAPMYSFGGVGTRAGARPLGPGPAYRIDKVTRDGVEQSPAWTFGSRYPVRATGQRTPGPGAHAPERCPPLSARAPQYSLGARLGRDSKRLGPAPNAYQVRLAGGSPAYTMGTKGTTTIKTLSPGPAVYYQRDTNVYLPKQPEYTLGSRLQGAGRMGRTPGPAAYPPNLYNFKKTPYSYSFGIKHNPYAPPLVIAEDTMDCLD